MLSTERVDWDIISASRNILGGDRCTSRWETSGLCSCSRIAFREDLSLEKYLDKLQEGRVGT
jgi:hypothetical protein